MSASGETLVRGTCVALSGAGLLLLGASGTGKSDLALRLIDGGATLVSDDYVKLRREAATLYARPPETIAGLLEVRGLGLLAFPHVADVPLRAAVACVPGGTVPRMPADHFFACLGVRLPQFALAALEPSTPAKIRALLRALLTQGFRNDP